MPIIDQQKVCPSLACLRQQNRRRRRQHRRRATACVALCAWTTLPDSVANAARTVWFTPAAGGPAAHLRELPAGLQTLEQEAPGTLPPPPPTPLPLWCSFVADAIHMMHVFGRATTAGSDRSWEGLASADLPSTLAGTLIWPWGGLDQESGFLELVNWSMYVRATRTGDYTLRLFSATAYSGVNGCITLIDFSVIKSGCIGNDTAVETRLGNQCRARCGLERLCAMVTQHHALSTSTTREARTRADQTHGTSASAVGHSPAGPSSPGAGRSSGPPSPHPDLC